MLDLLAPTASTFRWVAVDRSRHLLGGVGQQRQPPGSSCLACIWSNERIGRTLDTVERAVAA